MELYNLYNQCVSEIYNHPWLSATTAAILIISGFRRLVKKLKEREENIKKCKELINHNLYTKAIEHCESIAKKYNEHIIHKYLGLAYLHINQIELAIENFKKVEKQLNSPRRFFNLYILDKANFYEEFADVLRDLNRIDDAMEYYKKALEEQTQKKGKCAINTNTLTLLQKITELSEKYGNFDILDKIIDYYEEIVVYLDPFPSKQLFVYRKLSKLYEKKGNTIIANKMREKIKEIETKYEKKEEKNENKEKKTEELAITDNPIL